MRVIEQLGLTKKKFKKMYDANSGFNNTFNKNHPVYGQDEAFEAFLKAGSNSLLRDELELIRDIQNVEV